MVSRRWTVAALVLGIAAGVAQAAPAEVAGAERIVARTLPNGLKIVVWPDHDIPNVAMYTWYRAGSRNEVHPTRIRYNGAAKA